ncbi:Uncharacterised protein [Serratia entomophila]|nr:Uncharacterised protein [Serratia entomophila]CAI0813508.1 Uncharacterised protein [Serratia entomophila]CAI0854108.1 Uncharacterised protein [Serratia entomophila]CAI0870784.1 Uncharacterised protein [Serratia entomophila]CAI0878107.1 Uncharacterised protein [Serratia entomophila]
MSSNLRRLLSVMTLFHRFKLPLLSVLNLDDHFSFRMPLGKVGKSLPGLCKGEHLVDHGLDLFGFYELADLVKLIAIRTDKEK